MRILRQQIKSLLNLLQNIWLEASLSGTDLNASIAWNRQFFFFAKNTNGKIRVRIIHDGFKLKSFFSSQRKSSTSTSVKCGQAHLLLVRQQLHWWDCQKFANTNKNTNVTNNLFENSDHKINFAKPKILGTARNRTTLFILETLSVDKLTPDINLDHLSIILCLFNA